MATYAIGDIQGEFDVLMRLVERIRFAPETDRLWLVGDVVNRGPKSLEVLRWLHRHRAAVTMVLGNHDIYALARRFDATAKTSDETLGALMSAPDRDELCDWLLGRAVMHEGDGYALVHAGFLPAWDLAIAQAEARAVEAMLRADPAGFLGAYFGKRRHPWSTRLFAEDRAIAALAVMTRIRFVDTEGRAVPGSGPPESPPAPNLCPWFRAPGRGTAGAPIVFGHWASLGLWLERDIMALDSGAVWNGSLTALRLDDRAVFAVPNRKDCD